MANVVVSPGQCEPESVSETGESSVVNSDKGFAIGVVLTVTVKLQRAVLPEVSVAMQLTVVMPLGKVAPEGGLQDAMTSAQLSLALTVNRTRCSQAPAAAVTVMFAGQVIIGGSLSRTVTVKLQVAEPPKVSIATQFTGVVPRGKAEPEGGVQKIVTSEQGLTGCAVTR